MILQALEKLLADHCSGADVARIEAGDPGRALWRQIEQAGFLELLRSEAQGGAGLALPELFAVLECLGRFAVPLPIAQSIVARALVGSQAILPTAMVTLSTRLHRHRDGGAACLSTPCAAVADFVLACDGDAMVLLACANARREAVGDARSLSANLHWHKPEAVFHLPVGGAHLHAFAAAMAAAMLSGAMQRVFDMALEHCNNRVQFGRPIGKFQAVQQQLSVMAEQVLAAAIASEAAFRCEGSAPQLLAAAIAKSRTSEAAGLVAATAHAVHGAIGMTDEYGLGILTRRLHDWRISYGAEQYWNKCVGAQVLASASRLADFVRTA